jgi:hypothetical protein
VPDQHAAVAGGIALFEQQPARGALTGKTQSSRPRCSTMTASVGKYARASSAPMMR